MADHVTRTVEHDVHVVCVHPVVARARRVGGVILRRGGGEVGGGRSHVVVEVCRASSCRHRLRVNRSGVEAGNILKLNTTVGGLEERRVLHRGGRKAVLRGAKLR